MNRDERGYIVVETVGAFLPFVLLMLFIVTLVNVAAMEAKVHYALTQTAKEISIQSYMQVAAENERTRTVDKMQGTVGFLNGIQRYTNLFSRLFGIEPISQRELSAIFAISEGWQTNEIELIFARYMWYDSNSHDQYGLVGGVSAFDFSKSKVDFVEGVVDLVVEYSIDYTFLGILEQSSALSVTQSAVTKMWDGGNGKGYAYWKTGAHNTIDASGNYVGGGGSGGGGGSSRTIGNVESDGGIPSANGSSGGGFR